MNENIIAFVIIGIVGLVFVIGLIKWTMGVNEAIGMNESDSDINSRRKEK